jgi:hypothetical protein
MNIPLPNRWRSWLAVILIGFGARCPAQAQGTPVFSQMSSQAIGGGAYHYDIVLSNISQDPVGTFWFAWVPGMDFLPSMPVNIQPPPSWIYILNGGPGYSINFYANPHEAALQPGDALTFGFDSMDSPETLAGNSPFFPTYPILTSVVYTGAPLSGPEFVFVVESVPEPTTTILFALGMIMAVTVGRRSLYMRTG